MIIPPRIASEPRRRPHGDDGACRWRTFIGGAGLFLLLAATCLYAVARTAL